MITVFSSALTENNLFPSSGFLMFACFLSGSENGRCVASEYFTEPDIELTTENTANILSEYSF